ncbi:MAG: N-acetylmuramoyl-L-alanine amidase family protein, partial [Clostridium sp.]|nr:N-acetylmuramoyl-L-alanine amidase family protein [Clostridium sp.]
MIRRIKKTCSLILLTAAITSIVPAGLINNTANAAVNDSNIEVVKNEAKLASEESYDITKDSTVKTYIENQYKGQECDDVEIKGPVKTISITLSDSQTEMIIEKMGGDALISELLAQNLASDKESKLYNNIDGARAFVSAYKDSDQVKAGKDKVKSGLSDQIKGAFKSIPIYQYEVSKDKTIVGKGYVVGGNLAGLLKKAGKEPIILKIDPLILDLSNMTSENLAALKQKIIQSITQNIGAIIDKTGIGSIVSGVTDAVGDLADSLDDLADSLKDKSDDIDDAWDKVFDRFDNDEGWGKRDGYIYYYDEDGISLKGVQKINGKTYYFNRIDGAMETGWQIVDGKRCYFDKDKGYQV